MKLKLWMSHRRLDAMERTHRVNCIGNNNNHKHLLHAMSKKSKLAKNPFVRLTVHHTPPSRVSDFDAATPESVIHAVANLARCTKLMNEQLHTFAAILLCSHTVSPKKNISHAYEWSDIRIACNSIASQRNEHRNFRLCICVSALVWRMIVSGFWFWFW